VLLNGDSSLIIHALSRIQIAKNLPVSNTGSVTLTFKPTPSGTSIVVPIKHSALLHPGNYQVIAPGHIVIANISYDPSLHYFNVKVAGDAKEAQFSVLVNLADVGPVSEA